MRRWQAVAGVAIFLLAATALAQQWDERGPNLDSFYGKRSFQFITVGAAPYLLPRGGMLEEVSFGFNTLSRRTEPKHWKNYYGAALNVAAGQKLPYDFRQFQQADMDLWYGSILIQSKIFFNDNSRVRPYLGLEGGGGFGAVSLYDLEDDVEKPDDPRLSLVRVGLEAGVHIALGERVALVISDTTSAYFGVLANDQFFIFPSTVYVGIAIWKGLPDEERWD